MVQNEKTVTDANGVLSQLWRLFLYDIRIKAPVWDMMLMDYIENSKTTVDPKVADNWKSNLPKDLAREQISWSAFCQGLEVLDFKTCKVYIELEKEGKSNETIINLSQSFGSFDYNTHLSEALESINSSYPEIADSYEALWQDYVSKLKTKNVELPSFVKHNLLNALSAKTGTTWNSFYRGLTVYNFDVIRLSIEFTTKTNITRVTTLEIS
jgi:hypothetical protein